MMTNVERFEWSLLVSESELIAHAARVAGGLTDGQAQAISQNILLHPGMLATFRRVGLDDANIGLAMLDPHGFADEVLADSESVGQG
jgi:hypothetical protein